MGARSALIVISFLSALSSYACIVAPEFFFSVFSSNASVWLHESVQSLMPLVALESAAFSFVYLYFALFASPYAQKVACFATFCSQIAFFFILLNVSVTSPALGLHWTKSFTFQPLFALLALYGFFSSRRSQTGEKISHSWMVFLWVSLWTLLGCVSLYACTSNYAFQKVILIMQPNITLSQEYFPFFFLSNSSSSTTAAGVVMSAPHGAFVFFLGWLSCLCLTCAMTLLITRERQVLNCISVLVVLELAFILVHKFILTTGRAVSGWDIRVNLVEIPLMFITLILNNPPPPSSSSSTPQNKAKKN